MSKKEERKELKKYFNIADLLLLVVLLFLGAASYFASNIVKDAGYTVAVTVDGDYYGVYALDFDRNVSVDTEYGHNLVCIKNSRVSVKESDCPNHDCEGYGEISMAGQTIVCLPHHLSVTIVGQNGVDAVVG